jgi:hypothetical protein
MEPDQTTPDPPLPALAVYCLFAGVFMVGTVLLVGHLLAGLGGGLALGIQAGVAVALLVAGGEAADPLLLWITKPLRGGGRHGA